MVSMSTLKAWTRDEIARGFLLAAQGFTLGNRTGESYCLDSGIKLGLRDTYVSQGFIYSSERSWKLSLYHIKSQILMGLAQKRVKTCS
jgi:hypothetical protein